MSENKPDLSAQPGIKCQAVVLLDVNFHIKGGVIDPAKLNGDYEIQIKYGSSEVVNGAAQATMDVTLINKLHRDIVDLSVRVGAKFEGDTENLKTFLPNGGVLLIPYARTFISMITGWGPMSPVILPLMNLTKPALDAAQGAAAAPDNKGSTK